MTRILFVTAALLVLNLWASPWIEGRQASALVVDGATLIDGTGAGPVANSVIIIENGKITAIGPRARVRTPAGARTVDAKGKFVIPGLIDSHVHYRSWMGELFLNNGVTTIFDFGNDVDYIFPVRDAERSGKVKNIPRVFLVGAAINRPGGNYSPSQGANAGTPAAPAPAGTAMGPEWARSAAKDRISRGIDAVKVTSDNLTAEEMGAITDEAHKAHLKVIGHVTDVNKYVESGFDGVVHSWGVASTLMTPENKRKWGEQGAIMNPYAFMEPSKVEPLIKLMIEHRASYMPMVLNDLAGLTPRARYYEREVEDLYRSSGLRYVPAATVLAQIAMFGKFRSYSRTVGEYPRMDMLDPARLDEGRRGYTALMNFVLRFVKAGGRIWLGTDAPGSASVPGMSIRQEIELLVDAGLTPMQGIQAATKNTAELFNKADQVGTLQTGRWGDLLVLDANPLSDIGNIDKISTVIKAGEVLDARYHATYHPPFWAENEATRFESHTYDVPQIASVAAERDAAGVTIVVNGRSFYDISLVYLNGRPLETTFVNIGELRATLPADQPAVGPYNVTVRNSWPGGGASEAKPLSRQ
jgi:hypothetical protein